MFVKPSGMPGMPGMPGLGALGPQAAAAAAGNMLGQMPPLPGMGMPGMPGLGMPGGFDTSTNSQSDLQLCAFIQSRDMCRW